MARLTKRIVDAALHSGAGSTLVWDGELKGFGVRVFETGSKKFIVQYRTRAGQQRRMSLGAYGPLTVERARELARSLLGKVAEGDDPADVRKRQRDALSLSQLCDLYLEAAELGLITGRKGTPKKSSTLYTDRGRIERHIKPLLGNRKAGDIGRADIEAFKTSVALGKTAADVKTRKFGRAIVKGGRGTATRTLGLLGSIFQWGLDNGHIDQNPVRGVKRFADQQRKALLSAEQYSALGVALDELLARKAANGSSIHSVYGLACIRLIALSGFRKGEAEQLRWDDIDSGSGTILLGDTKTGESIRPLTRSMADLLETLTRMSGYVFPGTLEDQPYSGVPKLWKVVQATVAANVLKAGEGENLDGITLHALRHSFAGVAEDQGASLPTIAALLGHRLSGVTAGYVLKRIDKPLLVFADRVARSIDTAMRGASNSSTVTTLFVGAQYERH